MQKPILAAFEVPWFLARSVDHLLLDTDSDDRPTFVEFTACFRQWFGSDQAGTGGNFAYIAPDPISYRPARDDERAPYHRIRVYLQGGVTYRWNEPFAEGHAFDPDRYDTRSKIPVGDLNEGETVAEWLKRGDDYQIRTGLSSNACVYDVEGSLWLAQLGLDGGTYKHLLFERDSEPYLDVIAEAWTWELGQPTS